MKYSTDDEDMTKALRDLDNLGRHERRISKKRRSIMSELDDDPTQMPTL